MLSDNYKGAYRLTEDLKTALQTLATCLSIQQSECDTHTCVQLNNFEADEALEATAIYLVSSIAQTIDANLQIREALFDEVTAQRDLLADILSVIGEEDSEEEFKTMVRDPWIWEGMSHMIVHLSRYNPSFCPAGSIVATSGIKYDVHDHGLDLIGIYDSGELGIVAGECKAYSKNPGSAITDASNKLREIDTNKRDIEIRSTVNPLRSGMSLDDQERVAGAFWRKERSYMPFVCCDIDSAKDWLRNRNSMRRLSVPVSRKVLLPLALSTVRSRFDQICDQMREYPTI
jgi:hypothetical protein